jgi:hypothetical protein
MSGFATPGTSDAALAVEEDIEVFDASAPEHIRDASHIMVSQEPHLRTVLSPLGRASSLAGTAIVRENTVSMIAATHLRMRHVELGAPMPPEQQDGPTGGSAVPNTSDVTRVPTSWWKRCQGRLRDALDTTETPSASRAGAVAHWASSARRLLPGPQRRSCRERASTLLFSGLATLFFDTIVLVNTIAVIIQVLY